MTIYSTYRLQLFFPGVYIYENKQQQGEKQQTVNHDQDRNDIKKIKEIKEKGKRQYKVSVKECHLLTLRTFINYRSI